MPAKLTEKQKEVKQMPLRIHANDKKILKLQLSNDGLSFQTFFNCCIQAYLAGDKTFLRMVQQWKEVNTIPKEDRSKYTLSQREREKILLELEQGTEESDE